MPTDKPEESIDWDLTTWEGSRREKLRRWAKLPLERVIAALEEMQEVSEALSDSRTAGENEPRPTTGAVQKQHGDDVPKADGSNKPNNQGGDGG